MNQSKSSFFILQKFASYKELRLKTHNLNHKHVLCQLLSHPPPLPWVAAFAGQLVVLWKDSQHFCDLTEYAESVVSKRSDSLVGEIGERSEIPNLMYLHLRQLQADQLTQHSKTTFSCNMFK